MSGITSDAGPPVLSVEQLTVDYGVADGRLTAVEDVSFSIGAGEVVALVGESGSGKSTIAHAVMGILPPSARVRAGRITLGDTDLTALSERGLRRVRGLRASLVPQDPTASLNPVHRIGPQAAEPLRLHHLVTGRAALRGRAVTLLEQVRLDQPALRAAQYPSSLSGGMRQRVLIAAAISTSPELLVADEPTTALDVTVQRRILDDLERLREQENLSVLLVTHDLALAAERADRVVVLRAGRVVESGMSSAVLDSPADPYTRHLLRSTPAWTAATRPAREQPAGAPPAGAPPAGAPPAGAPPAPLVQAAAVTKDFAGRRAGGAGVVRAVSSVSLSVAAGETVGLVGESGSGKSTLGRLILGLTTPTAGTVTYAGQDITRLGRSGQKELYRRAQLVYQNPYSSLSPRLTVAEILTEPLDGYGIGSRSQRQQAVRELLDRVRLPHAHLRRRPSELSGGQRQRVAIARALAPGPEFIVLDEAVSALDVTLQAQLLELLLAYQAETNVSYLFISHDLAVVRAISHRVAVMKGGVIVEEGAAARVLGEPAHEYTRELLAAVPARPPGLQAPALGRQPA